MSDKEPTIADIQQEYSQICGKLGHAEVQLRTLSAEIPRLHERAQSLILESARIQALPKPEKKEEAAT